LDARPPLTIHRLDPQVPPATLRSRQAEQPAPTHSDGEAEASRPEGPPELQSKHVLVAGVVTHRQRPATAGGTMFINLEDETGLVNVIASRGCWMRYRAVARGAPALIVRGRLERAEGVVNVVAEKITELHLDLGPLRSRNFR
jgi:DNA polymerase III alpha subunit